VPRRSTPCELSEIRIQVGGNDIDLNCYFTEKVPSVRCAALFNDLSDIGDEVYIRLTHRLIASVFKNILGLGVEAHCRESITNQDILTFEHLHKYGAISYLN
jgi:hypothetical protein